MTRPLLRTRFPPCCHHCRRGAQLVLPDRCLCLSQDIGADAFVPLNDLRRCQDAAGHQQGSRSKERIASVISADLGRGPVGHLRVAAGMAHEPHGVQVQDRRSAASSHMLGGGRRRVVRRHRVGTVGVEVRDRLPTGKVGGVFGKLSKWYRGEF